MAILTAPYNYTMYNLNSKHICNDKLTADNFLDINKFIKNITHTNFFQLLFNLLYFYPKDNKTDILEVIEQILIKGFAIYFHKDTKFTERFISTIFNNKCIFIDKNYINIDIENFNKIFAQFSFKYYIKTGNYSYFICFNGNKQKKLTKFKIYNTSSGTNINITFNNLILKQPSFGLKSGQQGNAFILKDFK